MEKRAPVSSLICSYTGCNRAFPNWKELFNHNRDHINVVPTPTTVTDDPPPIQPVICPNHGCSLSFANPQDLLHHAWEHLRSDLEATDAGAKIRPDTLMKLQDMFNYQKEALTDLISKVNKPTCSVEPANQNTPAAAKKTGQQIRRQRKRGKRKANKRASAATGNSNKQEGTDTDVNEKDSDGVNSLTQIADVKEQTDLSAPVEIAGPSLIKNAQVAGQCSSLTVSDYTTDSSDGIEVGSSIFLGQCQTKLLECESMLEQVRLCQKEFRSQIHEVAAIQMSKEGKRIEEAIQKKIEKLEKDDFDVYWARSQEDFAKLEELNKEWHQQVLTSASAAFKEALVATQNMLRKEIDAVVPAVGHALTPVLEKAISTAFQRRGADRAVKELEKTVNSALTAAVSSQIEANFQTSGKQAIQEAVKFSVEASLVPVFNRSCQVLVENVDTSFYKGMIEHSKAVEQTVESTCSPLVFALRDVIDSASSMTETLNNELAYGRMRMMAGSSSDLMTTGAIYEKVEATVDPVRERLSRLLNEHRFEEAFTDALERRDVKIVAWLCCEVDVHEILGRSLLPQVVLLALLQQLACDIGNDTNQKLSWMMDVVVAINPSDGVIALSVRPIFEQVYSLLIKQAKFSANSEVMSRIDALGQLLMSKVTTVGRDV